jgi:hypothetical protein
MVQYQLNNRKWEAVHSPLHSSRIEAEDNLDNHILEPTATPVLTPPTLASLKALHHFKDATRNFQTFILA